MNLLTLQIDSYLLGISLLKVDTDNFTKQSISTDIFIPSTVFIAYLLRF